MGTTFALRQSEGTSPVSSEVLKIKVRIGAISIANCYIKMYTTRTFIATNWGSVIVRNLF